MKRAVFAKSQFYNQTASRLGTYRSCSIKKVAVIQNATQHPSVVVIQVHTSIFCLIPPVTQDSWEENWPGSLAALTLLSRLAHRHTKKKPSFCWAEEMQQRSWTSPCGCKEGEEILASFASSSYEKGFPMDRDAWNSLAAGNNCLQEGSLYSNGDQCSLDHDADRL